MSKVEKSFTTIGLQPELLSKVATCVAQAAAKAQSDSEIQSIEVSRPGFRQDLYLGRIMVMPPSVMLDPEKVPSALLHGAILKLFDGEEATNLETHRLATTEFDQLTPEDLKQYQEKVFTGPDGKQVSLVFFLPAWGGDHDFHAFRYTKDMEALTLLLRHLVFGAYFRPSLSGLYQTLSEDPVKLDAVNLEHEQMNPAAQFKGPVDAYPVFEKKGSRILVADDQPEPLDADDVIQGYTECILWVGIDDEDKPLENNYGFEDFSDDAKHKIDEDCRAFCNLAQGHCEELSGEQVGHLFWLNRNGHGTGFWDQDDLSEENQKFLDELSHQFGECDAYIGDDGKIELTGGSIPAPLPPSPFKSSSKLRVTASNLAQVRAATISSDEQKVMAELERQALAKMSNKGDAGSTRIPTSPDTGLHGTEAPEVEHIASIEDGDLKARPDYGSPEAYTTKANEAQEGKLASALFGKLADDEVHNGWTEMQSLFRSDFAPDARDNEEDHKKQASVGGMKCPMCKSAAQKLWALNERQYGRCSKCGDFSLNPAKTAFRKEAIAFVHPGQALEQFYPDVLNELSNYPIGYPERDYTAPPLQLQEGTPVTDSSTVTLEDYSDNGMMHSNGAPGLIQTQDLESAPLRSNERAIRGPYFLDQFYRDHCEIPPALLTIKSSLQKQAKVAASINKVEVVSEFLKGIAGELAASLLAAFKVTSRPCFTYTPCYATLDLKEYLTPSDYPGRAVSPTAFAEQLKALVQSLNSGDLTEALNQAYAQSAVWHESDQDSYTYEIFVRLEDFDTDSLKIRYKYLSGKKEE